MPRTPHQPTPTDAIGAPIVSAAEVREEVVLEGIGVAPGIAIGAVYRYDGQQYLAAPESVDEHEIDDEIERFEQAIARSERELLKIKTVAHEKVGEGSGQIFDAQLLLLRDAGFYDETVCRIREERERAAYAAQTVLESHRRRLESSGHAGLRERAADFLDVQNRVVRNLQQGRARSNIAPDRIVVAENLTAADILLFSRRGVRAVVLDFGGPTSHVSIMARALGVPAVVSLHDVADTLEDDETLIVDGFSGRVVRNPTEQTLERYHAKQARYQSLRDERESLVAAPAETLDGHRVSLQANLEFREELPLLHEYGAEGVGLFRTEMLFLMQGKPLDEDEQYEVYRDVVRAAAPHPVTFRLIDLGGDKVMPLAHREANPFLGWRGIRILLQKPDLLKPQLRAVLRAGAEGAARILLPMISSIDEVRRFRSVLDEVCDGLERDGVLYERHVPVGLMVEVPSVALMADVFAAEADFFSLGTNDLTQYTLAVDRGNDLVANRYRELSPAVLALIRRTVEAGHAAGIPVSVCGEMAADPRVTPLLVGLGVDALSASPAYLTLVKRALRAMTYEEAQSVARRALDAADPNDVAQLLRAWLHDHTPDLAVLLGVEAPSD